MTLRTCISGTLLFVWSAWAADAPGQPADSASVAPTSPAVQVDEVLALAPADASFIAYAAEAKTAFNHPVLAEGFPSVRSDLRPLFDSLAKTFDGAAMISLSGVPINPLTWQVTVAARIGIDREELFRRLTDEIVPARYLNTSDPAELAAHCMEDVDPEFLKRMQSGDIIVGGKNFGCGSSREHAPVAIKTSGISCVIAKSFARIFFRNAINIGLPILLCEEAAADAEAGDEMRFTDNQAIEIKIAKIRVESGLLVASQETAANRRVQIGGDRA